ncbi:MAG TPA: nitrate reductase molybdenum cofactor assembly chaperone [Gammaproteobacteria bacterium]
MIIYTLLSRLLDYPEPDLKGHVEFMRKLIAHEPSLNTAERGVISAFLDYLEATPQITLEEGYVQTFDMIPEHSLHLTHHLFGDDRGRGPALVDLGEHYKGMGLEVKAGELPDYLPLILEYVSTLDEMEARVFLADAHKVVTVIAANLEQAGSPYAPLLRLVEGRGQLVRLAS